MISRRVMSPTGFSFLYQKIEQEDGAKEDAVDAEGGEAVLFYVGHQGADDKERGEKGGEGAEEKEEALGKGKGKAEFEKL